MYKSPKTNVNDLQRIVDDIYRAMNELSGRVPQTSAQTLDKPNEEVGKIKIEKTDSNTFSMSIKTDEGFVETNMNFKE